ncbi:DNA translocase FtsK [Alicyclobacillaceae bacterium I2511]|nr:DNA translocase FtsK [Alicyclobacillaceae bacterium I2511]
MGRKQHREPILQYELIGLAMLTLCALALGKLGLVGRYLDISFIYLAGSWSFLIPIFLGYAAVVVMIRRGPFVWTTRHMGLLVLLIVWLTFMEFDFFQYMNQFYPNNQVPLWSATLAAMRVLQDMMATGSAVQSPPPAGGGLVGYAVFSLLYSLFSTLGALLILSVGALVGILLVLQRSLVVTVQKGSRWMEKRLEAVWRGSQQYVEVLFRSESIKDQEHLHSHPSSKEDDPSTVADGRYSSPGNGLVIEGEVLEEKLSPPVVHDFSTRVRPLAAVSTSHIEGESGALKLQQVDGKLVMRFPERKAIQPGAVNKHQGESNETSLRNYSVGPPIHDENYQLPPLRLFTLPKPLKGGFNHRNAQENARKLENTLESFGVHAKVLEISRGPSVTRYELQPAVGVKVSRIVNLADDIALALAARDIRIEAPVPGKPVIGIEVPNEDVAVVTLREVLDSDEFQGEVGKLGIVLGRDISGQSIVGNLQKMPHLLVAGATGSGKSVCINSIVASILVKAKPHEVKFLMIDPKMVELSGYNGIPHLMAPVVTDPRKAAFALKRVIEEMEARYKLFADRGARDLDRYNQLRKQDGAELLPYIVVIVDELADLMMVAPGEVEDAICRIAQMARAAGIHLILATQRPSVDVITGVIKANIPSRIAFAVSSMADSRTILDGGGAEKLLGRGDMLYMPVGAAKPVRVQGAFVSEPEIEQLVEYVKSQQRVVYTVDLSHGETDPQGNEQPDLDELFMDAVDLVVGAGQASVSLIQRRFRVGYARAARIVDQMEQRGVVGPFEGSKPREVLVSQEQWQALKLTWQKNTNS